MRNLILLLLLALLAACGNQNKQPQQLQQADTLSVSPQRFDTHLVVYCYNSLTIPGGFGTRAADEFGQANNCYVELVGMGNGDNLANALLLEGLNCRADVVMGIDNLHAWQVLQADLLEKLDPEDWDLLDKKQMFDRYKRLIPFDWGYYALVYDTLAVSNPPVSFGQMQDGRWEDKFLLVNPSTHPLGQGLLLWTVAVSGPNGYGNFWKGFKNNVLATLATPEAALARFTTGQAPFVLSYSTLPAYFMQKLNISRYQAIIPLEGAFRQIEAVGVLKTSAQKELAAKFVDYLISSQAQKMIPEGQWLYPARKDISLPPEFARLPVPKQDVTGNLSLEDLSKYRQQWLQRWNKVMN